MLDFKEGLKLYNRLVEDGYISFEINPMPEELEVKICELAKKYYKWTPAEPSSKITICKEYKEMLEQQTASDRLNHIWEIAVDWDGYRTIRGMGKLLDEIIDCSSIECKEENEVINQLTIFTNYQNLDDFFNLQKFPLYWSFPSSKCDEIQNYCKENNLKCEFLTFNRDKEGLIFACAFKIEKDV